jgi:hypothetical protein
MPAPMIDRALATARSLAAALPLATEKGKDNHTGREFDFVPARELVRAAAVVLPQASLSLRARGESVSQWGLTVTYRLTHADGDFDEWTSVTPLSQAVRPELAIDWARTASLKAAIRGLLWIGAAESPDPCETGQPKLAESRTQRQAQEDERREKKGLEPYHRNGSGRSTKASRATAALADAMSESPVAVELGDEEREKEAAMDLEAARLAAEPSSLPPVKDPDWLEDEPKAQAHQKPAPDVDRRGDWYWQVYSQHRDACALCGDMTTMERCPDGAALFVRYTDHQAKRLAAELAGGPDSNQPASPPVATPTGSMDGDEGEVTPTKESVSEAAHSTTLPSANANAHASAGGQMTEGSPSNAGPSGGGGLSPAAGSAVGGLPAGAPSGGEQGAVVEPPASEDCPSGAGAPPAPSLVEAAAALMDAAGAALDAKWKHGPGSPEHLEARARADKAREGLRAAELVTCLTDGSPVPVPGLECPECGSRVEVGVEAWETDTGIPAEEGCYVGCEMEDEGEEEHRYLQSDWQEVRDKATAWAIRALRRAVEPRSRCAECDAPLAADSEECPDPECPTNAGPQEGPTLPAPGWMAEPAWPGDTPTPAEDVQREQPKPTPAQRLAAAMLDDPSDPEPVKPEQVASLAAGIAAAEPSLGASSFVAWLKKSTTPGPIEQAATVQGRKDRAARWGLCPQKSVTTRTKVEPCALCALDVDSGPYRQGVEGDPSDLTKKRRGSKPVGRAHQACVDALARGEDPREEGAEAPESEVTT